MKYILQIKSNYFMKMGDKSNNLILLTLLIVLYTKNGHHCLTLL